MIIYCDLSSKPEKKDKGSKIACNIWLNFNRGISPKLGSYSVVRFTMYFRRIFVESMKTIHFWKAYGIGNQKNNVSICPESNMAAILHSTKWPPWNRVYGNISARY